MPLEALLDGRPLAAAIGGRSLYVSAGAEAIVAGANARSSMLPANAVGGASSVAIGAGQMPSGAFLRLEGSGLIGARALTPPAFTLVPWIQAAGGPKVDLPGFSYAPLLGAPGVCEVWLILSQLGQSVRTSGFVRYGLENGMPYSIPLNAGAVAGAPALLASDPTVDRTFGVDGYWAAGAAATEYVRNRAVAVSLFQPG